MIDRIAPTSPIALPARIGGVTRAAAAKGAAAADTAPVSPAAALAAAGPPVDLAKVERIRAGIRDGSYRPDPAGIAAGMVDLDLPRAP